jgi:hypothetical protein
MPVSGLPAQAFVRLSFGILTPPEVSGTTYSGRTVDLNLLDHAHIGLTEPEHATVRFKMGTRWREQGQQNRNGFATREVRLLKCQHDLRF